MVGRLTWRLRCRSMLWAGKSNGTRKSRIWNVRLTVLIPG